MQTTPHDRAKAREEKKKAKIEAQKPFLFALVEEWTDTLHTKYKTVRREKIAWCVFQNLPECDTIPVLEFSKQYKIPTATLYTWRVDDEFEEVRKYFIRRFLVQDTSKVLANLAKGAQFS